MIDSLETLKSGLESVSSKIDVARKRGMSWSAQTICQKIKYSMRSIQGMTFFLQYNILGIKQIASSVQSLSRIQLFVTPWITARQASLSLTISRNFPNSYPSIRCCRPAISSSVVLFSSCPQSFPASGSFPKSQLFTSGGQSIGASASVLQTPCD